jgi:hypothetical protein
MISKSIANAQHKLEEMTSTEIPSNSSADWFKKNKKEVS